MNCAHHQQETGRKNMIKYCPPVQQATNQDETPPVQSERLTPLLKWAGGKQHELKYILPLIPSFERYYEPFIGGGAVFFSLQAQNSFINDKSPELFQLYTMVAQRNSNFFQIVELLLSSWQALSTFVECHANELITAYTLYSTNARSLEETLHSLLAFIQCHHSDFTALVAPLFQPEAAHFMYELQRNLFSKTRRMKTLEQKKWLLPERDILANIECAIKSAFYMHLRHLYNHTPQYQLSPAVASAIFFFVRENAYASMFRYNRQGKFNVPYGGISYNRKDLARKIAYLRSETLQHFLSQSVIENLDFAAFFRKHPPQTNDFIFLDPPYDSEFSTYAQNEFSLSDQERLVMYLKHHCPAKFMLVIKNTPTILKLYDQADLNIRAFDKTYRVSFQDRNDRHTEHLVITNY